MRMRFHRAIFGFLGLLLVGSVLGPVPRGFAQYAPDEDRESLVLGHSGYVIISSGLDSTKGFHWQIGPGPGQRSLTWAHGVLTLPVTQEVESLLEVDLAIPCTGYLSGLGNSGQLVFKDGIFEVSEPILLSDGNLQLYLAAGELEVRGQRIRYNGPAEPGTDPRAGYVFLAGMILLVVVLLRRAALRHRKKS